MSNMAGSGTAELRTPVFNGENYEFWSIRMKTILKSHGLWDLVENGFNDSDLKKEKEEATDTEKSTMAQILMKDARALGLIQSVVSDQLFPRIVNEETSNGAWHILKLEFRGDKQVRNVKLQGLRREFEYTRMKDSESLSVYLVRLFDMLNQMKSYGKPKCHGCGKFGHMIRDCNGNKNAHKVNYANQVEETGTLFYVCNAATNVKVNHLWYIDSGCSNHMIGDEGLLVNIQRNLTFKVKMGTGEVVPVAGKGTLVIKTKLGKKHIQEVMFVPGLEENLLSVGQMMEHGYYLVFGGNMVNIYDDQSLRNLIVRVQMTNNISVVCEGYMLGKQHRDSFPLESTWRATSPLELVHTDICGLMKTESISGNRKFKAMTKLQSGYKIKGLRSDRGGETSPLTLFKAMPSPKVLLNGRILSTIQRQLTIAYSPQQNEVAERKNRTVVEMANSMLHEKGIPYEFWAEAVTTVVYLLNRCPTKSLNKGTPFEAYTGIKPGIAH
ncbi:unnamed protein product [Prunus armeniaca]